ncbi:MAG TPA: LuxR C-terminal-related transcriptional regulator [Streptosporangiaceae bacterium]|nr:LuxR C-terminal-related transcriptional regulator [Streptosporangiaceae bacterium]
MTSGGGDSLPAGTVSMMVAYPVMPSPALSQAVAAAARAHSGTGLARGGPGDARHIAVFARASDAAACALAVQRALGAEALAAGIAVHTSHAGAGLAGYSGQAVGRCAALARAAWAGQVLLSQACAALLDDAGQPADCVLTDLGWHRLSDLGAAEHVWQLGHPDLPAAFPPLRSLDAYRHNLPVELSSFVPRDAELAELTALISDVRLVTLTGSGGCGKTRLALHAAASRIGTHADGVWLAEFASLRDPAQIAASVADVLQLRQRGPDSGPAELSAAIGTQQLLLVLDNCEHLIRWCAELADSLLRACPQLRILATSREPLGVPGEVTWRVPSLPFPVDPALVAPDDLIRFEAVGLFAERARLARPHFALTAENAAAVAEICARLDGIPLAIELAAAATRVFSVAQIAAGLQDRFRLLTGGARTAVARQQTLEASVAWSYDLLAEPERAALRQLSVFSGGFTLAAAAAVAIGADQPEDVLPQVSQLADKSLIVAAEDGAGDRFRMLETIRDYAAARLLEAGEAAGARARHFAFFSQAVDQFPAEDEDSYCQRLRADYDNILAALRWAGGQDDPELLLGLATRLIVFWSASTHLAEAVQWLRNATERGRDADPGLRARALGALTQVASLALNLPVAFAAGNEGLGVLRQLGDSEGIVMTLTSLGSSATLIAEPEADRPYLDEAIALAEEIGDQRALAYALAVRGRAATSFPADRPAGREALRRSIAVARRCGARHVEGIALGILGVLSSLDGSPAEAIPPLTEALPLLREAGDVFFLSLTLIGLVQSLALSGDHDAALAPCQELESISGQLGAAQLYFAPCARGFAGYSRGDWPEAIRSFREQLTFFSPVRMGGMWVGHLAWAEFLGGQAETAQRRLDEFIASADPARISLALPWAVRAVIARSSGEHELATELAQQAAVASPDDPFGQSTVIECLAVLAAVRADAGEHEVAVRLAGAVAAFADGAGVQQPPSVREVLDPATQACRDALGADGFGSAWSQGQRLTLAEAVSYATRGRGPRARPAQGWESLTPTELTVARAVADGLSNPQIAARMFISRRTVTTHLTSIFRKLSITSRAELAARVTRREGQSATSRIKP